MEEFEDLSEEEEDEMGEKVGKVEGGWDYNVKSGMVVPMKRVMEMEILMNEVFDSVSASKSFFGSLQEAHCPWDPERMRVADVAVVGELGRLAFFRERFRRCVSVGSGGGRRRGIGGDGMGMLREVVAPFEASVEELKQEVKEREVAFSLDPAPSQFEVSRGAEFHPQYMESVVKFSSERIPIVGFPVSPGLKLGNGSVIKASVYLVPRARVSAA